MMSWIANSLITISLPVVLFAGTASAQTLSSCVLEGSLEENWKNAKSVSEAVDIAFGDAQKDVVALAIIDWGQKGMMSADNPDGLVPNKTNKRLSDAMGCYVLTAMCDMSRKKMAFKTYKSMWKTGQWKANPVIPQYAPRHLIRWAETQLGCSADMSPIKFDTVPAPIAVAQNTPQTENSSGPFVGDTLYGGTVVGRTHNADGTGTVTVRKNVTAKPAEKSALIGETSTPKGKQSYDEYLKQYRIENFSKSCENGVSESCWALGWEHVKNKAYSRGSSKFRAQMKKACDMGHSQACKDMSISTPSKTANSNTAPKQKSNNYGAMEIGPLQQACTQSNDSEACIELYKRMRGTDPEAYVVAEHLCYTYNWADYCYKAGLDLQMGNGGTPTDRDRAFNNFYKGCYISGKGRSESCYQGAMIRLADGGRNGLYDAMLMLESPCYSGYRDSCALKKKAKRGGDAVVAAAKKKFRANHDDAMNCKKTRVVGNGGREYTSYDCRTNREWRLGKKR